MFFVSFFGTIGYSFFFPDRDWSDLFFMTVISLSTVGYEDSLGVKNFFGAKIYTSFLILSGLVIIAYCTSKIGIILLEGDFKHFFGMKYLKRKLEKLENHYIVCGSGTTGQHIIQEMTVLGEPFILIESNYETINSIMDLCPDLDVIAGDATSDEMLQKANIDKAKGIFFSLSSDKENLFGTVTARLLNPSIRIIARAVDDSIKKKLLRSGANEIVSPNIMGGYSMIAEMFRPKTVDFWENLLRCDTNNLESSIVRKNSSVENKTIKELRIMDEFEILIIGYAEHFESNRYIFNPDGHEVLRENFIIFYIADMEKKKKIDELCS